MQGYAACRGCSCTQGDPSSFQRVNSISQGHPPKLPQQQLCLLTRISWSQKAAAVYTTVRGGFLTVHTHTGVTLYLRPFSTGQVTHSVTQRSPLPSLGQHLSTGEASINTNKIRVQFSYQN